MTLYAFIFYLLAALILVSTGLAITHRNLVHAIIYLVVSFFGSALLFYLLGAPLLAVLEVIIYAGAIMVLFLFIVMMMRIEEAPGRLAPRAQLVPAVVVSAGYLIVGLFLLAKEDGGRSDLIPAIAAPAQFGHYLFTRHWLAVELASLLLLVALVGVLMLADGQAKGHDSEANDP